MASKHQFENIPEMEQCYLLHRLLHIFEPSQKVTCERYEQMLDHQRRQNQKSGRPDQGVVINIECDAECHVQERNRKIAEALEIDQPTISSELDVIYPESVIRFAQGKLVSYDLK